MQNMLSTSIHALVYTMVATHYEIYVVHISLLVRPRERLRSIAMSMSVCVCVCLCVSVCVCVCLSASISSEPHARSFPIFPCMLPMCPFSEGRARSSCNITRPGPRPTFIPSGILIHPAVWPQQTWAEIGGGLCLWWVELGLHQTQCCPGRGLPSYEVAS